ncbi:SH3 domain-containing protein [Lentzea sp. BCCO 10_0856]|uniref:SH3 domain-containing protein n=1 Tax=Lentzea miocenica TaxID=3095431 RepID=A0ABU4T2T6_9PSEU|nr:SH3 domain-containing protein [Lentzea sp. BCCO 10_0856]MDX8032466.1 SH3 domain-containing protein [Lentzea sp. BCCO 10_0856]
MLGVLGVAGVMFLVNGGKPIGGNESTAGVCKITVTADILNVRSGPGDMQPIVSTMPRDAVADAQARVENGYRMLSDRRWVSQQFVALTSDSTCK